MDIPGQNCCWYTISFWEWWLECSLICFVFPTWNEGSRWESSIKQWCCFMLLSSRIQNQTLNHTFCYTNPASWSFLNGSPCWRQSCWRKHDRRAAPFRFDIKRSCKAEESHSQQVGRVSVSQKKYNIYIYIFKYGGTINEDNADHLFSNMDFFYWIVGLLWAKAINVKATFYQELALPVAFVDLGGSPAPLLVIIRTRKNHEIWQLLYQSCYRFPKDR